MVERLEPGVGGVGGRVICLTQPQFYHWLGNRDGKARKPIIAIVMTYWAWPK